MTQISGEGSSRLRHSRESAARAGAVSRESVRQYRVVNTHRPDLAEKVKVGTMVLNAAYREAIGEDRSPLYMQLPASLDAKVREAAGEMECSRQRVVVMALAQFFDDVPRGDER